MPPTPIFCNDTYLLTSKTDKDNLVYIEYKKLSQPPQSSLKVQPTPHLRVILRVLYIITGMDNVGR